MLKRMVLLILLAVLLCSTRIYATTPKQEVVFSFDFNKRFKLATNQFAVWIENDKGELIKTLFVTALLLVRDGRNAQMHSSRGGKPCKRNL